MALSPLLVIAAAAATVLASPDLVFKGVGWAKVGTYADMLKVYPKAAHKQGVPGHATLTCQVLTDGKLTACKAEDEGPPGQGFGKAALRLTHKFQRFPDSTAPPGPPQPAGVIHIPIVFGLSPPAPPATAPGATAPAGTP